MSPQLTLQTPIQLPPEEIPSYLEQLWSNDKPGKTGSNTFSLLVWQPAWIEQELIRTKRLSGPIMGTHYQELIEAAKEVILEKDLPHSTAPFDKSVLTSLVSTQTSKATDKEDLRGQHIDAAISELQPRRLITLAPTLKKDHALETLVAAYCPLPEEGGNSTCGDAVVMRGDLKSLIKGLKFLKELVPSELPSWMWWNGSLDECTELLDQLAIPSRRLIIDTALGEPAHCLNFLQQKIKADQAVNDLNWLRLRTWRETLAMVFDPPHRREALNNVVQVDIDIEGDHPVQGLLLISWIANRLNWTLKESRKGEMGSYESKFEKDGQTINFHLIPLPIGNPGINPGQIVGLRMICKADDERNSVCIILGAESGECMRLEAGGMASMKLLEEVVPIQTASLEMDVARLLSTSRGTTSPLLANAAPTAAKLFKLANN